jgi:hypothetical protein
MHGIGLGNRARWGIVATYLLCVIVNYYARGWDVLEVLRIPLAEFALVYLFAALAWLPFLYRRARATER